MEIAVESSSRDSLEESRPESSQESQVEFKSIYLAHSQHSLHFTHCTSLTAMHVQYDTAMVAYISIAQLEKRVVVELFLVHCAVPLISVSYSMGMCNVSVHTSFVRMKRFL